MGKNTFGNRDVVW